MSFSRESAAETAKRDLAERLDIDLSKITVKEIVDREFSDMSLGAPTDDEFAAQMISNGWQIKLAADGRAFEYRGDKYQLRLFQFNFENFMIAG